MPGLSATTAGSAFGFALQVYINSVRKLPLTRSASRNGRGRTTMIEEVETCRNPS